MSSVEDAEVLVEPWAIAPRTLPLSTSHDAARLPRARAPPGARRREAVTERLNPRPSRPPGAVRLEPGTAVAVAWLGRELVGD